MANLELSDFIFAFLSLIISTCSYGVFSNSYLKEHPELFFKKRKYPNLRHLFLTGILGILLTSISYFCYIWF